MDSLSGNNCLRIEGNSFTNNVAIQGGAVDFNIYAGPTCLYLSRNTYEKNQGYDANSHIGSGSVVKILMINCYIGPIYSQNNKYLNNFGEVKGLIIFFSYVK